MVSEALLQRLTLVATQEAEAERGPVDCLAGHQSFGVPGTACTCGLTRLPPSTAYYFNAVFFCGVERRRKAGL
jgi:hypothetical protein